MLKKTIEDWNKFVDEIKNPLLAKARNYLNWHISNREMPTAFGKECWDWTDEEIVKWYKEFVR